MIALPAGNVAAIVSRTLNYLDIRLVDHGWRVAETVAAALLLQGRRDPDACRKASLLALLHDVGAYRTDEVDDMVRFETVDVWPHAVCGYSYIKHLSPLPEFAPAILHHHADAEATAKLDGPNRELAQLIHIADRLDILGGGRDVGCLAGSRLFADESVYDPDLLELIREAVLGDAARKRGLADLFADVVFTPEEVAGYVNLLVRAVEFRSRRTAAHTPTAVAIAGELARLIGFGEVARAVVAMGTLLHDLGKQGVPVDFFETPDALSPRESALLRAHVDFSVDIVDGNVPVAVVRVVARHHERMNGSGYPRGLHAGELQLPERLIAVADTLSALLCARSPGRDNRGAVLRALAGHRDLGKLDAGMVTLALDNFDTLFAAFEQAEREVLNTYTRVRSEYVEMMESLPVGGFERKRVAGEYLPFAR